MTLVEALRGLNAAQYPGFAQRLMVEAAAAIEAHEKRVAAEAARWAARHGMAR